MDIYPPHFRIADRYDVIQEPKAGNMGLVYICRDIEKNQLVALKFFKHDYLFDRIARKRFLEESNAWIKLGIHPNIVRCYTVKYKDPTAFLVLELIANEHYPQDASLDAWMGIPMSIEQALLFALQIARGMQYAVEKIPGLVHCDLKPANVLVRADSLPGTNTNRLCVTDFGMLKIVGSRSAADRDLNRVRVNPNLGSPEYMAPEQWKNEPVGVYTDVYALGCILYDMLAGRCTSREMSRGEVRAAHIIGELRPLSPKIPASLHPFLKCSMRVVAQERYQTWSEVTFALEELYASLGMGPAPRENEEYVIDQEQFALASSYNAMGIHCAHLGKTQDAIEYFENALDIFKKINHLQGEGAVLGNLGNAYARMGRMDDALRLCEQDLDIACKRKDRLREGMALGNIGEIYRNLGDVRRAIGFQEQRLSIVKETEDLRGEGNTLSSLGMAYAAVGDVKAAINCYKKQLAITRRIEDRRGRGNAWGNLGNIYFQLGEARRAILFYDLYLKIAKELGDRAGEGNALGNLGSAYLTLGDIHFAIDIFYSVSLEIAREIGDRRAEGNALGNLGIAYGRLGETQRALDYYQQRLEIAKEIDDKEGLCSALFNMGLIYMQKGQTQVAFRMWIYLYVFAKQKKLTQVLHRLANFAPKIGLPEGLDGWEIMAQGDDNRKVPGSIDDYWITYEKDQPDPYKGSGTGDVVS